MSTEGAKPPAKDEETTRELAPTEKNDLEELIPFTADLRARGFPDWRIKEEQRKVYPGPLWDKIIDMALKAVTEEQVINAKEEGIKGAMGYVISKKADGLEDWQVEDAGSRQRAPFVKEALSRVTPGQVAEEVRRRPKLTPGMVKTEQLVEKLKWEPEYLLLPEDDRKLAEGILRMRWDGDSYVKIRYLFGDTQDYEYLKRFDRAWVTTNFVKAEMLLEGRRPPRQTARGRRRSRKNRENSPEWQHYWEQLRRARDLATMHLWKEEGKCIACGQPASNPDHEGMEYSHHHKHEKCPMCGNEPDSVFGAYIQDVDNLSLWQMYCPAHRPHFMDRRREAILAQAAHFRKVKEETQKRRQQEKEKRALGRRKAKRMEPRARAEMQEEGREEEGGYEYHDREDERERRLEDGGW
jgi:hypothetical protein